MKSFFFLKLSEYLSSQSLSSSSINVVVPSPNVALERIVNCFELRDPGLKSALGYRLFWPKSPYAVGFLSSSTKMTEWCLKLHHNRILPHLFECGSLFTASPDVHLFWWEADMIPCLLADCCRRFGVLHPRLQDLCSLGCLRLHRPWNVRQCLSTVTSSFPTRLASSWTPL